MLDWRVGVVLLVLVILAAYLFSYSISRREVPKTGAVGRMFPFYLPWDDSSATATSLAGLLDKPAGKYGHVYVGRDGHLYVGGRRIRFLGTNVCGGAAFPEKDASEKIAARIAKFGINLVRFHHMDNPWETNIFGRRQGTRQLDPVMLDRLDYFIYQLKKNGIYVDLNLLVSRKFTSVDGLPAEINSVDWKDQQVIGFFMDKMLELEKEYARQLLRHRNPYTGLTYAEDPAVAFVEIVNEQGLIHGWLGGVIDRLPQIFKQELQKKWNQYLLEKYGSTKALAEAWAGEGNVFGEEMLTNGCFENGTAGWSFETHDGAEASFQLFDGPGGMKALRVVVTKLGKEKWHVQFNYPGLRVKEGETYLVSFMARADRKVTVYVSLMQAHEPWHLVSNRVEIELGPEWRNYTVTLTASYSEDNARFDVTYLGAEKATYEFACFSLRPFKGYALREGESLERGTVPIFELRNYGLRTWKARKDWVEFLWHLEEKYFLEMYRYLKEGLGVKALVIGTIVGCSTPNIMAKLDVVDTHAYWQHPAFPGRPWDPGNWYVWNRPMVNYPLSSTVQWLAVKRVYGKPHMVTEYNHPAPNMYDVETAFFIATYAALQDWDGVLLFDYGGGRWDSKMIRGYFDIDQHPTKMASLIPAYMIFVRGDVESAQKLAVARLSSEREVELVARGKVWAWNLPDAGHLGVAAAVPLMHRVALVVNGEAQPAGTLNATELEVKADGIYRSDNGQVIWDYSRKDGGVLIVNTSKTVAVVGFVGNRSFDFGDVAIEVDGTLLQGFGAVALTSMDGREIDDSERLLLLTLGYAGNEGMVLRDYDTGKTIAEVRTDIGEIERFHGKLTCSGSWGHAPTLVEGINATIRLRVKGEVEVWALDNTGARKAQIPLVMDGDYAVIRVSREYRTIWYEVVVRK